MTDILDLPGWSVLGKTTEDGTDVLDAEYTVQPTACQKCGVIGHLYRHGTKPVTYLDIPIRGRPARLRAKVQRYRCRECSETFLQPLGGIQPERRMTERCARYIESLCLRDTFMRIGEDVGCDDKTVRNLAGEYISRLEASYRPSLPAWLGIDETQIDGKMRLVLTDIDARKPVEMLADRDKGTLTTWLNHYRDRSHVRGVAIDMWRPYRDVARQMLPGVPVVIDKFHVVRTASYCMERVRIRLQKLRKAGERREWLRSKATLNMRMAKLGVKARFNLDMWLANEPELAAAHGLKEAFYDIYDLPKAEAVAAYDAFAARVPANLKADFKVLLTAMKNWRTEILAYFDNPISNAYTEALNGVAKTINRQGRGYSFEVLRARLLFGKKVRPEEQPWRLATAFKAPDLPLRLLVKEQDGRCQSCGVELGRTKETLPHVAVLVRGHERKRTLVCGGCFEGFHTMALSHRSVPSTP
ncbi:MAG: ISL3 family transposase [Burkholderiales bacterium]|nr:ISL3 family transposase [Burkholderiales bacterium]